MTGVRIIGSKHFITHGTVIGECVIEMDRLHMVSNKCFSFHIGAQRTGEGSIALRYHEALKVIRTLEFPCNGQSKQQTLLVSIIYL